METTYRPFETGEVPGNFTYLTVTSTPGGSDNQYSVVKGLTLSWRKVEAHFTWWIPLSP